MLSGIDMKTYGIQAFNQSLYDELMFNWTRPGGCKERVKNCEQALKDNDPLFMSRGPGDVQKICGDVFGDCGWKAAAIYQTLDHGWYDIGHPKRDPFPAHYMAGYLTEESVLAALGVPVNYSSSSPAVAADFQNSFDMIRGGFIDAVAYLLDSGVKVHMMYGDRDYACNWIGGEKASLAIAYSRQADFANAGYSPLLTSEGIKGMTRQFGNFSFSRVYQAGHEVPSYQPEAAYEIFMRATFNRDIATGLLDVSDELSTLGPKDTWHIKNIPPVIPEPKCYTLLPETCPPEIWEKVRAGKVIVQDWQIIGEVSDDSKIEQQKDKSQKVIDEL
jgi:carboxypeptidase C (cathepsin A)